MAQILRHMIADYLNVGTKANPVWALCGTGFTTLDESPNAQLEATTYVSDKTASPTVKRYERTFAFETEVWNEQEAVMAIYNVAKNDSCGSDAIKQFLRTEFKVQEDGTPITTEVAAKLYDVSVEVTDITGEGGEVVVMSGNLNQFGDATFGTFNLSTRVWTDGGVITPPTVEALTLTIEDGQTTGNAKVTVSPQIAQDNSYLYKTSETELQSAALPAYNDYIGDGWTAWDGYDEIPVTDGYYVVVAEVSGSNLVKGVGQEQCQYSS